MDEEIRELRRWRHDIEGRGIMGLPERVAELEKSAHKEAINAAHLVSTIDTLKQGFLDIRRSIDGFHVEVGVIKESVSGELKRVKHLALIGVAILSLSSLMPEALVSQLIAAFIAVLR